MHLTVTKAIHSNKGKHGQIATTAHILISIKLLLKSLLRKTILTDYSVEN